MSVTPRILVTGGTGFIGSQLALHAARTGHPVTVASPINNDAERFRCDLLARAGIPIVDAALDDAARLREALAGHDTIIHLAAAQHEAEAPESHFHKVNVEGTRALFTLASRMAREFASRLEVVVVRISETYGPADLRLLKLFRAIKRGRYVTLGNGLNERQLIYVGDLCRALLAAAEAPTAIGQTMILAGSERLTTDAMVASICIALGKPAHCRHVPMWPFDIAARICETVLPPFGLKPPLHSRRLDFFRKSFRFSTKRAARLLGFRPQVPFATGAQLTADWYREAGLLA